jgi:LacI family transcriptional regulator
MKRRPATLRHIAEALGVTVTTVSKSLRNHPDVSAATRERVLAQAELMNYAPNVLARSLRSQNSGLVPMIITDIANPYFSEVVRGAEDILSARGYDILIFDNKEDVDRDLALVRKLRSISPAGVILTPALGNGRSAAALAAAGIPYVLANRHLAEDSHNCVVADDFAAACIGTNHLVRTRSRKVILVNGSLEISCAAERLRGYKAALEEHGVPFREDCVYTDRNDRAAGYAAAREILAAHEPPFAVLGYSDFVASGVLRFALERGVSIPDEVAVMGIDNIDLYSFTHPALSTVGLAKYEIGREAAKLLIRTIDDDHARAERIVMAPWLVLRESA